MSVAIVPFLRHGRDAKPPRERSAIVRKRARMTRPGAVIKTVAALDAELMKRPSIYWHGRCFPSAFVVNLSLAMLRNAVLGRQFQPSVLVEVTK